MGLVVCDGDKHEAGRVRVDKVKIWWGSKCVCGGVPGLVNGILDFGGSNSIAFFWNVWTKTMFLSNKPSLQLKLKLKKNIRKLWFSHNAKELH